MLSRTFAKLRDFFERAEGGEEFIDTGKVLRGMVCQIELDVVGEEVALTFLHPGLAELSNPEEAVRHGSTEPALEPPKHTGWCTRPTEVTRGMRSSEPRHMAFLAGCGHPAYNRGQ